MKNSNRGLKLKDKYLKLTLLKFKIGVVSQVYP
jgi:hypothetical protein